MRWRRHRIRMHLIDTAFPDKRIDSRFDMKKISCLDMRKMNRPDAAREFARDQARERKSPPSHA